MLEHLSVQNYALIDSLDLTFTPGFNVLTGETGAGKSILIGALGLLLGDRADASALRTGSSVMTVSASVKVPELSEVQEFLEQRGLETENSRVLLRRTVKDSGRGTITFQGTPVTRKELEQFAGMLFDVHGQHEHQSLMRPSAQRSMLDSYGRLNVEADTVRSLYYRLEKIKKDIEQTAAYDRERIREQDMLAYAVEEIDAAALKPGEQEELEKQILMLSQYEQLCDAVNSARSSASRGLDLLKESRAELDRAARIDDQLEGESQRVETMLFELEDVLQVLRGRLEQVQLRPGELDELQERLMVIRRMQKKYGDTVEEVLSYAQQARMSLQELELSEERLEALKLEQQQLFSQLSSASEELSRKRKVCAEQLSERMTVLLRELGMPYGSFHADIQERRDQSGEIRIGADGKDTVTFTISPNRGEPPKPLQSIASGGEISRVMLALKSVFARSDRIDTVIFDEIDAGIGGSVAVKVGEYLAELGRSRQVICITHLASIAARARTHFVVDKSLAGERTVTKLRRVTEEQRVAELARMLSGDSDRDTALAHARELSELNNQK